MFDVSYNTVANIISMFPEVHGDLAIREPPSSPRNRNWPRNRLQPVKKEPPKNNDAGQETCLPDFKWFTRL